MKRILNKKGSALIWAMLAVTVLSIVVAGILTLCMSYYLRSLRETSQYRVTLLSRSSIEYISGRISDGDALYIPPVDDGDTDEKENIITVEMDYDDFVCTTTIERESANVIRLYASTPYSDEKLTIEARMSYTASKWNFDGFVEG